MEWQQAEQEFFAGPGKAMSHDEYTNWNYQAWAQNMSVYGLWSYRGYLWKKYAGKYPTPEEVGLPANHTFFDPDFVDMSKTIGYDGVVKKVEYFHLGRKMKPTHRLWSKRPPSD